MRLKFDSKTEARSYYIRGRALKKQVVVGISFCKRSSRFLVDAETKYKPTKSHLQNTMQDSTNGALGASCLKREST